MNNKLSTLKPECVWKNFELLCSIPHPSKKESKMTEFLSQFGKKLGLETIVDEIGNVIIRKPASVPLLAEKKPKGIVLQAHMDMVPQPLDKTVHDFEKDPIEPWIDGEWVKAKGTTLGADNGIGVACAMAILEAKDIVHGPIEALFTVDEETGMTGAKELKPNLLKGDILINLDSENEGHFCIGCAGGVNTIIRMKYKEQNVPADSVALKITVTGLKGGHSGLEINLGRGNAIKIMNRLLWNGTKKFPIRLANFNGGTLHNVIPSNCTAIITIPKQKELEFHDFVTNFTKTVKSEIQSADPDLNIFTEQVALPQNLIDENTQYNLLNSIYSCPNGVISMSADMPGIPETSTNLATIESENGIITIKTLQRSSVESLKEDIANMVESCFTLAGAEVEHTGDYPGWRPNVNSPILKIMKEVYRKKFGTEAKIEVVHAGLECGILGSKYPHWDMISCGPTIKFPHSVDEKVNIPSVEKFWIFLLEVLKNVAEEK